MEDEHTRLRLRSEAGPEAAAAAAAAQAVSEECQRRLIEEAEVSRIPRALPSVPSFYALVDRARRVPLFVLLVLLLLSFPLASLALLITSRSHAPQGLRAQLATATASSRRLTEQVTLNSKPQPSTLNPKSEPLNPRWLGVGGTGRRGRTDVGEGRASSGGTQPPASVTSVISSQYHLRDVAIM